MTLFWVRIGGRLV